MQVQRKLGERLQRWSWNSHRTWWSIHWTMERRQSKSSYVSFLFDINRWLQRHGPGIFVSNTGVKYQGEWKDGIPTGKGVVIFKDENGKVVTESYTDGRKDSSSLT